MVLNTKSQKYSSNVQDYISLNDVIGISQTTTCLFRLIFSVLADVVKLFARLLHTSPLSGTNYVKGLSLSH